MKNNKVTKYLQRQAETSRQLMVLGAVLFITGIMSANIFGVTFALNSGNTNVNLNVTAGTLDITAAPTQFNLSAAIGDTATGNTGNGDPVTVNDATGSAAGWDLSLYYNDNFNNGGAVEIVINSTDNIFVNATLAVPNNIAPASSTGVTAQADFNLNGVGSSFVGTLVQATVGNGEGVYDIHNVTMDFTIPGATAPDDYSTEMIFTVA